MKRSILKRKNINSYTENTLIYPEKTRINYPTQEKGEAI